MGTKTTTCVNRILSFTAILLFLCAATPYVLLHKGWFDANVFRHWLAVPSFILTLAALKLLPWQMILAMLFCCVGDFGGSLSSVAGDILQMAGFLVAQVIMAFWFAGIARNGGKLFFKAVRPWALVFDALLLALIIPLIVMNVTPADGGIVIQLGVVLYCTAILSMATMAVAVSSTDGNFLLAIGGVCFLLSDLSLAMQRYVFESSHALHPVFSAAILPLYFIALLLLFTGSLRYKKVSSQDQ